MRVEIYGHSDDCIEVHGDLREEFNDPPKFLHFGDGTVLKVTYGEGDYWWRIERVREGAATIERLPGTYDGEDDQPCDKIVLDGDLKWVRCQATDGDLTRDELLEFFGDDVSSLRKVTTDRLIAAYKILTGSD